MNRRWLITKIIRYFKQLKGYLVESNGKLFSLLSRPALKVSHIKIDKRTLDRLKLILGVNDGTQLAAMLNYRRIGVRNNGQFGNFSLILDGVYFSADGFTLCLTFGGAGEDQEDDVNEDEGVDLSTVDVSTRAIGLFYLEKTTRLRARINQGEGTVEGIDPGVRNVVTATNSHSNLGLSQTQREAEKAPNC